MAAVMGLYQALYNPNSLILLVSASLRQSSELFKKVITLYRQLKRPLPASAETVLKLELMNKSRIISIPAKESNIRGYSSVNLIILDEAARVPDETYYALRPMMAVAKESRLIALSTPFGKRGWFYNTWENGGREWLKIKITALECPRISVDFSEREKRELGKFWYDQEYFCAFNENLSCVFSTEEIQHAFNEDVEAWF